MCVGLSPIGSTHCPESFKAAPSNVDRIPAAALRWGLAIGDARVQLTKELAIFVTAARIPLRAQRQGTIPKSARTCEWITIQSVSTYGLRRLVAFIRAQARRKICYMRAPAALIPTQIQHQLLALREERMVDPILCVGLTIERGTLNVNVPIRRIEVHILDAGRLASHRAGDIHRFEVRRDDQVHVLTWIPGRRSAQFEYGS